MRVYNICMLKANFQLNQNQFYSELLSGSSARS